MKNFIKQIFRKLLNLHIVTKWIELTSVKLPSTTLRLTPMQLQKYDDSDIKWAVPKKNADGSYTIIVKQLLSGYFNTKDVNQFCNTQKLWQEYT